MCMVMVMTYLTIPLLLLLLHIIMSEGVHGGVTPCWHLKPYSETSSLQSDDDDDVDHDDDDEKNQKVDSF